MKWIIVAISLFFLGASASAESCTKSREYILSGMAGALVEPAAGYRDLFHVCLQALTLANVKDAYILRDGGIAVIPKHNTLTATAETLSQFCERFPKNTMRFITPRELKRQLTVGSVVTMSSTGSTSCKKIRGVT